MDPSYNSFGSFGSGGTSGGRPVVVASVPNSVAGSAPKKSRRWLVVVAVLLLIGVGVGVGVFALLRGGVVGDDVSKNQVLFNRHANYLLFGELGEGQISPEYDDDLVYALDCENKSVDECREFFAEAKELLDDFIAVDYMSGLKDVLAGDVEYYLQTFNDYYTYIMVGVIDGDVLLKRYVDNGYDDTINYIEELYAGFRNSKDSSVVFYGNFLISMAEVELDIIKESDEHGCLVGYEYNQDCVDGFTPDATTLERLYELTDDEYMNDFMSHKRNDLVNGVSYVSRLLTKAGENNEN